MNGLELVAVWLGVAAVIAYATARGTGDGLGALALGWPVALIAMPFVLVVWTLNGLTAIGNRQKRGR